RIGTPREMSTRPAAPRTMFGLLAPFTATSAQASRSRPFSIRTSARRSFSIMLGRTSASWKFCVPRVRESTSTRSPPTASVSDLRSGMVVTTRSLRAPWAPETSVVSAIRTATMKVRRRIRVVSSILEWVRGVRAQDKGRLEEDLVDGLCRRIVLVERCDLCPIALGVLVGQPEAQELRGPEGDIRLDRPFEARLGRKLRRIVARSERPPPPRLQFTVEVPAEGVARTLLPHVVLHSPYRIEALGGERQQRVQPSLRPVLVLHVVAEDGAAQPILSLAGGARDPELDGAGVGELEERPEAARHERLVDPSVAERRLV